MNMVIRTKKTRDRVGGLIEFGPYRLTEDGVLHCPDDSQIQLSNRLVCILSELSRMSGKAVSRLDLVEHCWPGDTIGDESLTRAIADLRKVFRTHGVDCIETVYGLGYRLNIEQSDRGFQDRLYFCKEAWQRLYERRLATLTSAEDLFTRVVRMDDQFLSAWLGLAQTKIFSMQLGFTPTVESAPHARLFLDRALDLDPACADALAMKGLLLTWADWDFAGAETALEHARKLDPNAYVPNQAAAWHNLASGKLEAAERHARAAIAARPLSASARATCFFARFYQGDNVNALKLARETIRMEANSATGLGFAAICEAAVGTPAKAVSMAEQAFELLPESPVCAAILANTLARAGLSERARALLNSETKGGFPIGLNTMSSPAWIELGETESALAALDSGFATRCTWLLPMLHDPRINSLNCKPIKAAIFRQPL